MHHQLIVGSVQVSLPLLGLPDIVYLVWLLQVYLHPVHLGLGVDLFEVLFEHLDVDAVRFVRLYRLGGSDLSCV